MEKQLLASKLPETVKLWPSETCAEKPSSETEVEAG
jgi:hypothetical protein